MSVLVRSWLRVTTYLRQRQAAGVHPEAGQVVVEWLALGALGVVAIVGIWAGVKTIGDDVVSWISTQLGL